MSGALTVVYTDGVNVYQNTREVDKHTLSGVFSDFFSEVSETINFKEESLQNVNYRDLLPNKGGRKWKFSDLFNLDWNTTIKFEGREVDEEGNKITFSKAFTSFKCANPNCKNCDFAVLYRNESNPENVWLSHPPDKNSNKRTPIHRLQIERFESDFHKFYK